MKKIVIVFLLVLAAAFPASAKTVLDFQTGAGHTTFTDPLTKQDNFEKLVTDIGMMISYKPLAPSESLKGTILPFGFDIGVEASMTKIDKNKPYWQDAVKPWPSDALGSSQYFTKVHANVAIPVMPLEFGFVYGTSQDIDSMKFWGAEIKYAILSGGTLTPAVAIRGAYTVMSGIDILDVSTYQADISISKGIAFITPYAGVGEVWIKGKEKDIDPLIVLQDVSVNKTKGFVGARISFLPVLNIVAEGEFATVNTYSLRLNLSF